MASVDPGDSKTVGIVSKESWQKHDGLETRLPSDVDVLLETLGARSSWRESDRCSARQAILALAELAKHEENVDRIVDKGAVHALVPHLSAPVLAEGEGEVEKGAAFALGFAVRPEHQRLIADVGALPSLVSLLKRRGTGQSLRVVNGLVRRAADVITNLAHENGTIKTRVRTS